MHPIARKKPPQSRANKRYLFSLDCLILPIDHAAFGAEAAHLFTVYQLCRLRREIGMMDRTDKM